jgi:hypothetical protein
MAEETSGGWDFLGNLVQGGFAYLAAKETASQPQVLTAVDYPQQVGAVPYPITGLPAPQPAVPGQPGVVGLAAVPVWVWIGGSLLLAVVAISVLE